MIEKLNLKLLLTLCWAMVLAVALPACSNDDDPGQGKDSEEEGFLSPELMEKILSIYGSASYGPQTVTEVNQLAILTSMCASLEGRGPITLTPAQLNGKDITLLTLGGTQEVEGQATTMEESRLAAMGSDNDYLKAVVALFDNGTIPTSKPVLVTGISLGGMIAQQLMGVECVTSKYEIAAVITFGSPITLPIHREHYKVIRFADVNDKVPVLGESMLRMGLLTSGQMTKPELKTLLDALDNRERIARTSKYTDMISTHALSYIEDPCWSDIDFMGDKSKKNKLELKEEMHFYPAPKLN